MAPSTSFSTIFLWILLVANTRLARSSGGPSFFRRPPTIVSSGVTASGRRSFASPRFNGKSTYPKNSKRKRTIKSYDTCHDDDDDEDGTCATLSRKRFPPRGGESTAPTILPPGVDGFVTVVSTVTNLLVQMGSLILPPAVGAAKAIVGVYRALPKDAIVAGSGLMFCFAGGYYPTLFSSIQAAQQYGWDVMVQALTDLADEAILVIEALEADEKVKTSTYGMPMDEVSMVRSLRRKTSLVMATVDPMKINQAAGALYMTWVGVSTVLQQEYARVITLSLTMARYIDRVAQFILGPPAYFVVPDKYDKWVPVLIGWGCKAAAMNIAWRIQRIMSAATSAVTGGLLFARAISRMLAKRGIRVFGLFCEDDETTMFDEIIGFLVAGLGFYTQFESQWRSGFSFKVPFPLSLITWPFDWAERWIQWQITK
uniref:ABC transmembrane type-1 domain-containing protein n=1 Tax=Amphora coffeiformis TaxID=265554 RepID=A0A7S3PCK5_9STRA